MNLPVQIDIQEAYLKGLIQDVKTDRAQRRQEIIDELKDALVTPAALLGPDERRLLQLPPIALTPEERIQRQEIKDYLDSLYEGACYSWHDLSRVPEDRIFKLDLEEIPITFCFDIFGDILARGLVNTSLGFADVIIKLGLTGQSYQLPLNEDEVESLLGQTYVTGLDPSDYENTSYKNIPELKQIRDAQIELAALKYQLQRQQ